MDDYTEPTAEYLAENHITGGNRDYIYYKRIDTCLGRLILNSNVPQDMGFKPRNTLNDMFALEIDMKVGKKQLGQIVDMCFRKHGVAETARVLDNVKAMGYKYSTIGAVTVAVADVIVPPEKKPILEASEKARSARLKSSSSAACSPTKSATSASSRSGAETTDDVKSKIMDHMDEFNPIRMMTDSGARGSISQISQLAGMRGMMASPTGRPLEMPVKANFREGLTVLEFFQSSHGSRKALSDTALRTADSGYLTRRLVDVSQEVIVRERDCFASRHEKIRGITVTAIGSERDPIEKLIDRIVGRVAAEDVVNPLTGEVIVPCNEMISYDQGNAIIDLRHQVRADPFCADLPQRNRRLRQVLWSGFGARRLCQHRRSCRHRCRAGHRRAGHAADHAYLPYRRRCFRKGYHAGSSAR